MQPAKALFTIRAGGKTRGERRHYIPRGEGCSGNRSARNTPGLPAATFGRFSVRGPAAWRKDGGTRKNTNMMLCLCKALRCPLWLTSIPQANTGQVDVPRLSETLLPSVAPEQLRVLVRLVDVRPFLHNPAKSLQSLLSLKSFCPKSFSLTSR